MRADLECQPLVHGWQNTNEFRSLPGLFHLGSTRQAYLSQCILLDPVLPFPSSRISSRSQSHLNTYKILALLLVFWPRRGSCTRSTPLMAATPVLLAKTAKDEIEIPAHDAFAVEQTFRKDPRSTKRSWMEWRKHICRVALKLVRIPRTRQTCAERVQRSSISCCRFGEDSSSVDANVPLAWPQQPDSLVE